jgi:hypothetical protein
MFNQPLDIAWDKDDNFYVVQSHGGTSPPADCTFCATYDLPQVRNAKPRGVFVQPPVIPGSDPRVMKFDKDGKFLASASLAHADGLLPVIHSWWWRPMASVGGRPRLDQDRGVRQGPQAACPRDPGGESDLRLYVDATGQLWMSTGPSRHGAEDGLGRQVQGWFGKHGDVRDSNDVGEGHYMAVSKDQKYIFMADSVLAKVHRIVRN